MDLKFSYPGKKILIVDDEVDIREMMAGYLRKKEYLIATASNGLEALQVVKDAPPDLIITDIIMPEMDGYQFYKELKKDTKSAEIPILVLTARERMEDAFKALGVQDFLVKPFTPENLWSRVVMIFQLVELRNENKVAEPVAVPAPKKFVERISAQPGGIPPLVDFWTYKFDKEIKIERIVLGVTVASVVLVIIWGVVEMPYWLDLAENYETLRGSVPPSEVFEVKKGPRRGIPYQKVGNAQYLNGVYYDYDEYGRLQYEFLYENGHLKSKKTYDTRGVLVSVEAPAQK